MDRYALRLYLEREFPEIIAEAGIDLESILDAVEAVLGRTPDLDLLWLEPLAEYYLLRRAERAFTVQFPLSSEGDTYNLSKLFDQVQKLLAGVRAQVAWLVTPRAPDTSGAGEMVTIHMPFLDEPVGGATW